MPLYLVVNDDCDGENRDLFVNAEDPSEAVKLTLKFYEMTKSDFDTDFRVFTVPMVITHAPPSSAIEWPDATVIYVP